MTMDVIDAFPTPRPWRLAPSAEMTRFVEAFDARYTSGTGALHWALRVLPAAVPRRLWVPAYNCGVEVQAAIDAGFEVRAFPVDDTMAIDVEALARGLASDPGVVLLIHYFGFLRPERDVVAALARTQGVPLVEDCAHALFSTGAPGTPALVGDVAAFSVRKFLPLFDGGALRIGRAGALGALPFLSAAPSPVVAAAKRTLRSLLGEGLSDRLRRARDVAPVGVDAATVPLWADQAREYEYAMSPLSHRMLGAYAPLEVAERRRANLARLAGRLRDADHLPHPAAPGIATDVPLVLPIAVRGRAAFLAALALEGVRPYVFGEFAHEATPRGAHPASDRLRDTIVGLPIHQDLDASAIDRLAGIVTRLLPRHGAP